MGSMYCRGEWVQVVSGYACRGQLQTDDQFTGSAVKSEGVGREAVPLETDGGGLIWMRQQEKQHLSLYFAKLVIVFRH